MSETGGPDEQPEAPDASRSPLDVLLFAPVGVVMTVLDDLPGLIDKGRQRVELEVSNARVVGQVFVRAGHGELSRRLAQLLHRDGGTDDGAATGERTATAHPRSIPARPAPDPADNALVEQALAGYDTLSASQVVRRLESLDTDQLWAVHRYEASHRNRRTILNRAQQLADGDSPAPAHGAGG